MIQAFKEKIEQLPSKRLRTFAYCLIGLASVDFVCGGVLFGMEVSSLGWIAMALSASYGLIALPTLLMGYPNFSRIFTAYVALVVLEIAGSVFGPGSGIQLTIFIGAVYPFLVFEPHERWKILACLAVPFVLLVSLEMTNYQLFDTPHTGVSERHSPIYIVVGITTLAIVSITIYFYSLLSSKYEEKLNESNAQLELLIRTICHDINNPLTVAKNFLMLSTRKQGANRATDAMDRSLTMIENIVRNVASLQKIRSGKLEILREPVRLKDVLDETLFMFADQAQEKGVAIEISDQGDLSDHLMVSGNKSILAQSVFGNLMSNAIKYSHPDSTIRISVTHSGSGTVSVKVKDQGIGIPAKLIDQLFDPVKPTNRPGTANEKGTGFGLPIVRAYVHNMGGNIHVKSEELTEHGPESGTEFEVILKAS